MGNSKSSRSVHYSSNSKTPAQSTYILPSTSIDSLPGPWEVDTHVESDDPSEIPLRPTTTSRESLSNMKDGESSTGAHLSLQSTPSELSIADSGDQAPISRIHTAAKDLERKGSKASSITAERGKKDKNKNKSKEKEKGPKRRKRKSPRGHGILRKISFKQHKAKDKQKKSPRTRHSISLSSDPIKVSSESTTEHSETRVRNSNHVTAEFKVHLWRDKYEGGGKMDRILKLLHKKRARRLLRTVIDLQTTSLRSLRAHNGRKRD
ncbi:hypothetical protein H072_5080 [Dactylellina haptotyla CBS 200.50]|uniref:Uncharacterized protein n=1 Tax=Dactylellina haptotyla (strain CBS 200.50) TaxID=1284197 RepID=S8BNI7_DACHA|nr:hypothetical protein H072_5080 [Dactylellina haptotyla CBS 200.50]